MKYRFRSDYLQKIFNAAVKQNFEPGNLPGSTHVYLRCLQCGHREIFTTTGRGRLHETKKKINVLRRHGLIFDQRGGGHAAPLTVKPQDIGRRGLTR